jgi:alpha-tubulin suppressor-like RCC1 family protein
VKHKNAVTTPTESILPTANDDKETIGVKQVALGSNFSAFVDECLCRRVRRLVHGRTRWIQLFQHGLSPSYETPKLVESLVEEGCIVDSVAVGEAHTTALTVEGEVLTADVGDGVERQSSSINQAINQPINQPPPPPRGRACVHVHV